MAIKSVSKIQNHHTQPNLPSTVRVNEKLYRLSPNEEARILKDEAEKRRILRLIQTREAQKQASQKILAKNRFKKDKMVSDISEKLAQDWENAQNKKIEDLEFQIYRAEKDKGAGLKNKKIEEIRIARDKIIAEKREAEAKIRENEALLREKDLKLDLENQQLKVQLLKKEIKEKENLRASMIAKLGKEAEIKKQIEAKERELALLREKEPINKAIMLETIRGGIVESDFIIPENAVERCETESVDQAINNAIPEQERIDNLDQEYKELITEKRAQAEVRGEAALNKELANNDVSNLEKLAAKINRQTALKMGKELGKMRPDWRRAPEYMQAELKLQEQYRMEQAFEKIIPKNAFVDGRGNNDSFGDISNASRELSMTGFETKKSAPKKSVSINPKVQTSHGIDDGLNLSETTSDSTLTENLPVQENFSAEFRQPFVPEKLNSKLDQVNDLRRSLNQVDDILALSKSLTESFNTSTTEVTTTDLVTPTESDSVKTGDLDLTDFSATSRSLNTDEKVLIAAGLRPEEFLTQRSAPIKQPTAQEILKDLNLSDLSTSSVNTSLISNASRKIAKILEEPNDIQEDLDNTLTEHGLQNDSDITEFNKILKTAQNVAVTLNPNASPEKKIPAKLYEKPSIPLQDHDLSNSVSVSNTTETSQVATNTSHSISAGNSTSTTAQLENFANEVKTSQQVHSEFLKELNLQRQQIQEEIAEIRQRKLTSLTQAEISLAQSMSKQSAVKSLNLTEKSATKDTLGSLSLSNNTKFLEESSLSPSKDRLASTSKISPEAGSVEKSVNSPNIIKDPSVILKDISKELKFDSTLRQNLTETPNLSGPAEIKETPSYIDHMTTPVMTNRSKSTGKTGSKSGGSTSRLSWFERALTNQNQVKSNILNSSAVQTNSEISLGSQKLRPGESQNPVTTQTPVLTNSTQLSSVANTTEKSGSSNSSSKLPTLHWLRF